VADGSISVQPAAPASTTAPIAVKVFYQTDEFGVVTAIQNMMAIDEYGRFIAPLTEKTGRQILLAIRELHQAYVNNAGGMAPSANETLQEE
jgi:hypothetical protein